MRAIRVACRVITTVAIAIVGIAGSMWAQEISGSITDRTSYDRQAVVSTAPAFGEASAYSGFENNESVALYNGNLHVAHPSSPSFPINGGGGFSLTRVFDSQSVIDVQIATGTVASAKKSYLSGESWVGYGWKMNLGRIYKMGRFSQANTICPSGDTWCNSGRDYFFESADGSSTKFNSDLYQEGPYNKCMTNGQNVSRDPGPSMRVLYFRAPSEPASACEKCRACAPRGAMLVVTPMRRSAQTTASRAMYLPMARRTMK